MSTESIRDLAIKRHDIDASHFQSTYAGNNDSPRAKVFLYGRNMVIEELEDVLSALPKGSKVLDVGCGTAHLTHWIKQKGFEVYGIEPSENMYEFAVNNFPDIEIKKGISSSIPYPDQSFDLVVSFEVLRYLDRKENEATYKEFYRVLKPGGSFFVTQVNAFASDYYYIFHHVKSLYSKLTNSIHHHCNFTTPAAQKSLVKRIGFSEVKTIGRMFGSVRMFYKMGSKAGDLYKALMNTLSRQKFLNFYKLFSAHLIVIGKK